MGSDDRGLMMCYVITPAFADIVNLHREPQKTKTPRHAPAGFRLILQNKLQWWIKCYSVTWFCRVFCARDSEPWFRL